MSLRVSTESPIAKSSVGFPVNRRDPALQAWINSTGPGLSSQSVQLKHDQPLPPHPDYSLKGAAPVRKIEDQISSGHLHELKARFNAADKDGSGVLDLAEFIFMFDKLFGWTGSVKNEEQIKAFFMKIDYNSDGVIDWDEFCTYMQLELRKKEDAELRQKQVTFHVPANTVVSPHKDTICRIRSLYDGTLVSCSQDGIICFWTENMEVKRLRKSEMSVRGKPKWITDMAICNTHGKVILTTGDKEIQFFELVNFEPYCQLCQLDTTPLKMDFWSNPNDCNDCMLVYGDNMGCVNVLIISNLQEAFNYWKKGPKINNSPSMTLDSVANDPDSYTKYHRWKVHPDWIQWVRYIHGLRAVLSCCSDVDTSLVVGSPHGSTQVDQALKESVHVTVERSTSVYLPSSSSRAGSLTKARPKSAIPAKSRMQCDQRIFKVPKGIAMFDYSEKHKVIVTGGMDQIVRVWNPFVTNKPIGKMFGHTSPILFLVINDRHKHIYTIAFDNCVKVWDLTEYTCVISVTSAAHKVLTTVDVAYFSQTIQCIALANEQMSVLKLVPHGIHHEQVIKTHLLPVVAIEYSECFKQVLTACEDSVIKVWDIDTGMKIFEFCNVHDGHPITSIALDDTGRKLITAGQDGQVKIWNYNNGSCIRIMDKGNSEEITSVVYATVNLNRYVIGVGWDKEINVFSDVTDSVYQVQTPLQSWKTISKYSHADDILSVAYGEPHYLATGSFDGEIIIWNMISCYVYCKMKAPVPKEISNCKYLEGDMAISHLTFLNSRFHSRKSTCLVTSGPAGCVHFWNVNNSSRPLGYFVATTHRCISAMSTDSRDKVLVTADIKGFVVLWNIEKYCLDGSTTTPTKQISWRAHVQQITSVKIVDSKEILITSSEDCSVRLWTTMGQYIGTCGQHQMWNISDVNTYMHPFIPGEILMDPLSLPSCLKSYDSNTTETITQKNAQMQYAQHLDNDDDAEEEITIANVNFTVPGYLPEDEKLVGKRLRHERTHQECTPNVVSSYRALKCFAVEDSQHMTMQRPPKRPTEFLDFC